MNVRVLILLAVLVYANLLQQASAVSMPAEVAAFVRLKRPGNLAQTYQLAFKELQFGLYAGVFSTDIPLLVNRQVERRGNLQRITVTLTAQDDVYFNYNERLNTDFEHLDCQFYMPGFWYRRNLRSPKESPSFHTSDSWLVREDRLSTPLTAVYDEKNKRSVAVLRIDAFRDEAPASDKEEGEMIVPGKTSIGYTGFLNKDGKTCLVYGFPYREEPKSYLRKLTLSPPVEAFQLLHKGESLSLVWELNECEAVDFSECVRRMWEYCYDVYLPQPVESVYSPEYMKKVMSNYFIQSYVSGNLNYYASPEMRIDDCASPDKAEIGFVGRTLLNAFNALEYGDQQQRADLSAQARSVFSSYLSKGFSAAGFFHEVMRPEEGYIEPVHSIRRQSEGVYAVLYYLDYEKRNGRLHPEWEERIKEILEKFLQLQNADGSFPRKFRDDFSLVDASSGSTPSATLPLVMGYKYFQDNRFLECARRTVDYLEKHIISKADYFSSTLDANCEDKEASLYAATAIYYLALVSESDEKARYVSLMRKAAYFALSWYYTWDVPFAPGQMLGEIGLKTRGWGNVSVENNHIDVFVFDFVDVLHWLARECNEQRFANFAEVISTSMRQLLPCEGFLCGVAKVGYYPEVVQHTHWDYGHNGKGYYNDIFAPGWTVASLWELLTPGRAERFLK